MCKLVWGVACVSTAQKGMVDIHRSCPPPSCSSGNDAVAGLGGAGTCFTCRDKGHKQGRMSVRCSEPWLPAPILCAVHTSNVGTRVTISLPSY